MLIVGINAYHGDASAAALRDGLLVAAAEEERFTRVKHEAGFPAEALRYVVEAAGGPERELLLAIARDPWARLFQKARWALRMPAAAAARGKVQSRFASIGVQAARALGVAPELIRIRRVEHHRAHIASAFLVSPFDQAAVLSLDGFGDFASAMWGIGRGTRIEPAGAVAFPHSLGIFYSAMTQYLGFERYGDEYKVMGLASYGEPEFLDECRRMVQTVEAEEGFQLELDYFRHHRGGIAMTWEKGEPRIGRLYADLLARRLGPPRRPDEPVEARHRNIAASAQRRLEEVVLHSAGALQRRTGMRNLCLAGGVGFNCVANGRILEETDFDSIYVQSAAGDAGLAVGAALYVSAREARSTRRDVMRHSYWGPEFGRAAIAASLAARATEFQRSGATIRELSEGELVHRTAEALDRGRIVGWFQGRMEWGPRALGNRSILADPRRVEVRQVLNEKIKRRETFRPFAPAILEERVGEFFEQVHPSPFMLLAYRVRAAARARIPATTHVDGTGRLQTVGRRENPRFYRLIEAFDRITGVPVLLNTSFNENEPVVCDPQQAIDCFLRTHMDVLVLGDYMVERVDMGEARPLPSGRVQRE